MDTSTLTLFFGNSFRDLFAHSFSVGVKLIFVLLFVIAVLLLARRFIKRFKDTIKEHNAYEQQAISFSNIAGDIFLYVVLIFSASVGLYLVGFKSTYLILGMTFATGYAFKELFQNVIAGLLIMTTKEFVVGDLLEVYVDDVVYFGKIETITIRYTVIRKLDMTRVVIPNRVLTRVPVMTFGAEENVRLQTTFVLTPTVDLHIFLPKMRKVVMDLESVTEKEFTLLTLDGFMDGNMLLTVYFYFDPSAGKLRFRVISEVHVALSEFFKAHDIVFAYSHEVLTIDEKDSAWSNVLQNYRHCTLK